MTGLRHHMTVLVLCLAEAGQALASGTAATAGEDDIVTLPSGLETTLQEVLWDRPGGGLVYRYRFVSPEFDRSTEFETTMVDLEYLCNEFALPRIANTGPQPSQVIVSLADKPSEFGIYDPSITQVFEAYSVENGICIWEAF